MKGYAYADLDNDIVYKTADYIDNMNPGFFSQNRHLITKRWIFDTDDLQSMMRMFRDFQDLRVTVTSSSAFLSAIGFDMTRLKNADKI